MRRFSEGLQLVEKLNDRAASENPGGSRGALEATQFHNAVLSSEDEHDVLVYIGNAAAYAQDRKQNTTSKSCELYSYAAWLSRMLRNMDYTA